MKKNTILGVQQELFEMLLESYIKGKTKEELEHIKYDLPLVGQQMINKEIKKIEEIKLMKKQNLICDNPGSENEELNNLYEQYKEDKCSITLELLYKKTIEKKDIDYALLLSVNFKEKELEEENKKLYDIILNDNSKEPYKYAEIIYKYIYEVKDANVKELLVRLINYSLEYDRVTQNRMLGIKNSIQLVNKLSKEYNVYIKNFDIYVFDFIRKLKIKTATKQDVEGFTIIIERLITEKHKQDIMKQKNKH